MEACVGINRTDDFLYESMTEPIGIERMIYCIHVIFRNIQRVGSNTVSKSMQD